MIRADISSPGIINGRLKRRFPAPYSRRVRWLWSLRTRKSYPWRRYHRVTNSGVALPSDSVVWQCRLPLNHFAFGMKWRPCGRELGPSQSRSFTEAYQMGIIYRLTPIAALPERLTYRKQDGCQAFEGNIVYNSLSNSIMRSRRYWTRGEA